MPLSMYLAFIDLKILRDFSLRNLEKNASDTKCEILRFFENLFVRIVSF